ncbi:MAG: DUF2179 domain-containing protein [Erysipelothrix sp.]|nr:DUF2179 domain-containing protein [Erysipelothrix sp.]
MRNIILILILQLCYVPMLALRTISMVKKLTLLTAFFGFLESIIYVFGLALVLTGDQSTLAMLVYAIGYSLGLMIGIKVEDRIAIGYRSVLVNIKTINHDLVQSLRNQGYGVTVTHGDGREGTRTMLDILTKRSSEKMLFKLIESYEPHAFITSFEPTRFKGGYIEQLMKKQNTNKKPSPQSEIDKVKGLRKALKRIVEEVKELFRLKQGTK